MIFYLHWTKHLPDKSGIPDGTLNLTIFTTRDYLSLSKYMFKVNNRNTKTKCKICSKLTTKTPKPRH